MKTDSSAKASILIFIISVTIVPVFFLTAVYTDADWMNFPAFALLATPLIGVSFGISGLKQNKTLAGIGLTLNLLLILGATLFVWYFLTVVALG